MNFRPIAGSLTEARGQKANMHVFKEMLELCEVIWQMGYSHDPETPQLKVILFGELFNVSWIFLRLDTFFSSMTNDDFFFVFFRCTSR